MDGNGAADLQQADFALAGRIFGAERSTGLHPQTLALFLVVAIAHGDAVIIRGRVPLVQVSHQLFQRLFKALLASTGHTAGEDLAFLEKDHRFDAQDVGRTAGDLADASAFDEVVEVAHREEDLVRRTLCAQPVHGLFQRAAAVAHGHGIFHHDGLGDGRRRSVHDLDLRVRVILQHQLTGIAGAAHAAAHFAGEAEAEHRAARRGMGAERRLEILQRRQAGLGVCRRIVHHKLVEVPHRDLLALFAVVLAVQRDIEGDDLNIQPGRRFGGQVAGAVCNDIKHK